MMSLRQHSVLLVTTLMSGLVCTTKSTGSGLMASAAVGLTTGTGTPQIMTLISLEPINLNGLWLDTDCSIKLPFVCYNGTRLAREFVFVNILKDWMSAQKYCRESYTDLATVSSHAENKKINDLTNKTSAWIVLFRDDKFSWSDGMSFQFSRWDNVGNLIGSMRIICGVSSVKRSVDWKFLSCETKLPFVCYSLPPEVKRATEMMMESEDSVDLNKPALKANILKKLQDSLEEKGVRGVSLEWTETAGGKQAEAEKEG